MEPDVLVAELARARIGHTFNQYAQGPRAALLRTRLRDYLASRAGARLLLVGEAPGYRGARVSGIPFTSERQLTGAGPSEATATIVRRTLSELALEEHALCWNVVPTHPGSSSSNRAPSRGEVLAGLRFVEALAAGRCVIPVGRVAARALGVSGIRHPSHGGARAFRDELVLAVGRGDRAAAEGTMTRPRCYHPPPAIGRLPFLPSER